MDRYAERDAVAYTVAKESWTPTGKDTAKAFSGTNFCESLHVALVKLGVDLTTAFDQIQRSHRGVSETLHHPSEPH